ncbi:FIG00696879: hypothetical protein [plant metagenome]|uniref:Bacteriophage protein n=1 Tax=plant metagenome TaxID=1297885 RepID=A0A484U342_9ZZZZ
MGLDIQLDAKSHDLEFDAAGDMILRDGADRVAQQVKVTLLTFLGEWFLDVDFGVPYLEKVHIKAPQRAELEAIFRARIADVPGVLRVASLNIEIDRQQRLCSITAGVDTAEGRAVRVSILQ